MSSSPSRAPAPAPPGFQLEAFPYEAVPENLLRAKSGCDLLDVAGLGDSAAQQAQALLEARQQGQAEVRKAYEEQLGRERSGLASALTQFTRDRAAYFQKVESEIVQLALAIARKILHREAQVDPLLLAGIVRVALEQIDRATGVRLHIHPQNGAEWRRYLSLHLDPVDLPEIIDDPGQAVDQCTLETSMGTAQIGLEVQFKEIEQGLMDMIAARPR